MDVHRCPSFSSLAKLGFAKDGSTVALYGAYAPQWKPGRMIRMLPAVRFLFFADSAHARSQGSLACAHDTCQFTHCDRLKFNLVDCVGCLKLQKRANATRGALAGLTDQLG